MDTLVISQQLTISSLPTETNPARVYIAGLAAGASRTTMESTLNIIAEMLGSTMDTLPWHELRHEHLSRFRSKLQESLAPQTVNKYLAALRGTIEAAWHLNQIDTDSYTRAVKVANVKGHSLPAGRALQHNELEKLSDTIADDYGRKPQLSIRDAAIFAVSYNTGLRRAELTNLDLADYDREACSLHIRHGKGNKARMVFLQATARDAVDAWLLVRSEAPGPLFNRVLRSGRVVLTRLSPESIYTIFQTRQLQTAGGVKPFSPHSIRRATTGDMLDAGVPLHIVSAVLGHASADTTARYDRRGDREKARAAIKLNVPCAHSTGTGRAWSNTKGPHTEKPGDLNHQ